MRNNIQLRTGNCIRRAFFMVLASVTITALTPLLGQNPGVGGPKTLQGKLIIAGGGRPVLKTPEGQHAVDSQYAALLHTLEDERLQNRDVRLEGTLKPDGTFEATHLFTVHGSKLYKVRYYCNVCNITAVEPGNCVCCQRPTELQEIPLSEVGKDTAVVP